MKCKKSKNSIHVLEDSLNLTNNNDGNYSESSSEQSIRSGQSDPAPDKVNLSFPPSKQVEELSPYAKLNWIRENSPGDGWKLKERDGKVVGLYKVGEEIGCGTFAKVKIGLHLLTRERVALKVIDKTRLDPRMERLIPREISSMELLIHPCLIRLYEVVETPEKYFLVCELASGGDLRKRLKARGKLTEEFAKILYRQIIAGISFMHAKGIVHRDIKADNVFFFSPSHVKVGDFGFSTKSKKGLMLLTFCGSPPYAAPELFRDVSYEGFQVDLWALGVLLYYMVKGNLPFKGTSVPSLKKAILAGKYEIPSTFSPHLQQLLALTLEQKPSKRGTITEVVHSQWLTLVPERRKSITFSNPNFHQKNRVLLKKNSITGFPTQRQIQGGYLPEEERNALRALNSIGIPYPLIEENRLLGLRSHISGIYRIILHRYQEGSPVSLEFENESYSYFQELYKEFSIILDRADGDSTSSRNKSNNSINSKYSSKFKSKLCTII